MTETKCNQLFVYSSESISSVSTNTNGQIFRIPKSITLPSKMNCLLLHSESQQIISLATLYPSETLLETLSIYHFLSKICNFLILLSVNLNFKWVNGEEEAEIHTKKLSIYFLGGSGIENPWKEEENGSCQLLVWCTGEMIWYGTQHYSFCHLNIILLLIFHLRWIKL